MRWHSFHALTHIFTNYPRSVTFAFTAFSSYYRLGQCDPLSLRRHTKPLGSAKNVSEKCEAFCTVLQYFCFPVKNFSTNWYQCLGTINATRKLFPPLKTHSLDTGHTIHETKNKGNTRNIGNPFLVRRLRSSFKTGRIKYDSMRTCATTFILPNRLKFQTYLVTLKVTGFDGQSKFWDASFDFCSERCTGRKKSTCNRHWKWTMHSTR